MLVMFKVLKSNTTLCVQNIFKSGQIISCLYLFFYNMDNIAIIYVYEMKRKYALHVLEFIKRNAFHIYSRFKKIFASFLSPGN